MIAWICFHNNNCHVNIKNLENVHFEINESWKTFLRLMTNWMYALVMSFTRFRENPHYSCLNVTELLARSRREIWRLSESNWTRIQNHLVCIRTLNQLAKWLSVRFRTVGLKGWLNPFQKLEMPLMLVCLFGLIFLGEKIPKHNEKKSKCTKFTIKIVK